MKKTILIIVAIASMTIISSAQDRTIRIDEKQLKKSERVALVIGNSRYDESPLKNPENDAKDIAKALQGYGFDVTLLTNATKAQMREAIRVFGDKINAGGTGLFYFAGHGMQVGGLNYLIPVKCDIKREEEVPDEAVDASLVLRRMESAKNQMNIIILDACRNNPFARSFRSGSRGLVQMAAPSGSIIVYATAPGQVASDNPDGRNGLFTHYFLEHMKKPNIEIDELFRGVRKDVRVATNGAQLPWQESSLESKFYFRESYGKVASETDPTLVFMEKYNERFKKNSNKNGSTTRIFFTEGWIDDNTFVLTATGVPNSKLTTIDDRRKSSVMAALINALYQGIEKFKGSSTNDAISGTKNNAVSKEIDDYFGNIHVQGKSATKDFEMQYMVATVTFNSRKVEFKNFEMASPDCVKYYDEFMRTINLSPELGGGKIVHDDEQNAEVILVFNKSKRQVQGLFQGR